MAALSTNFTLNVHALGFGLSSPKPASKTAPQAPKSGATRLSGSAVGAYSCATRDIGSPHAPCVTIPRPKFQADSGFEPVLPKNRCTGGLKN